MPPIDKEKFSNIFTRLNVMLSERKKESNKTYFKKLSRHILFLILCVTMVFSQLYFESHAIMNSIVTPLNGAKYLVFFLPMGIMLIITIFLNNKRFLSAVYYGGIPIVVLGYSLYYLTKYYVDNGIAYEILNNLGYFMMGFGYGIVMGQIILIFFFLFNMSERLITALFLITLIFSYSFVKYIPLPDVVMYYVIPIVVLIISYITLLTLPKEDVTLVESKNEIIPKYSIVTLIILLLVIFISKGFGNAVEIQVHNRTLDVSKSFYSTTYYIGFLLSIAVVVLVFMFSKKSLLFLATIYFIGCFGSYQLTTFNMLFGGSVVFWRQAADVAFGFSGAMGYVLAIMTAGKILEDKGNRHVISYLVVCVLSFILAGSLITRAFQKADLRILCVVLLICTAILMLVFIIIFLLGYFDTRNTKNTPAGEISRNQPKYRLINPDDVLTLKEKSVFELLLEGLTLRQIAGELGVKYDSINFHYKNIYRKLEVNSKVELLLRYGNTKNQ